MAKLDNVKTIDMVNGEITKVEYNGEIYAKVEGTAEKGDLALANEWLVDTTAGAYYEVMMTSNHVVDEFRYYDDVDDAHHSFMSDNFTFFRKRSAPSLNERVSVLESKVATLEGEQGEEFITHDGAEYKLVDRKAQPGDVVYVTKDAKGTGDVPNKSFYLVEVDGKIGERWRNDVYKKYHNRTTDTVKVYEPVAQSTQAKQPLKVGDYAKVICERYGHQFSIGDIVELVDDSNRITKFEAHRVTDGDEWFISEKEIVRATDEEVAEAKKAQAEQAAVDAKWAKIGRKPNEFKKGDIVYANISNNHPNGVLASVHRGPIGSVQGGNYYLNNDTDVALGDRLELITPVESRFDRA